MNFQDLIMAPYLLVEDTTGVAGALLQVGDQVVGVEDEVAQDATATGGGEQLHGVAQGAVGESVGGRQTRVEGRDQVLGVEEGAGRVPVLGPQPHQLLLQEGVGCISGGRGVQVQVNLPGGNMRLN